MIRTRLVVLLLFATAVVVPPFALAQTCGDGAKTAGEECDDDNTFGGDGCAANCTLETDLLCELAQGSGETLQSAIFAIPISLSGQFALTVGGVRADEPADPVPFVIRQQRAYFALAVIPGIATSCTGVGEIPGWGPGNAGGGLIDCGAARRGGVDVVASIDSRAAQPMVTVERTGTGPMGSVSFEIGIADYTILTSASFCVAEPGTGPPQFGADAIPCTGDDPAAPPAVVWYGTSGTATARVLNANGSSNQVQTTASGQPLECGQLDGAGPLSGVKLVAALPALSVPQLGDAASTVTFVCAPSTVLSTPTPRIIQTCVPTPTPTRTPTSPMSGTPSPIATATLPATLTATSSISTPTPTAASASTSTATAPPPTATIPSSATASAAPSEPPASPTVMTPCTGDCNGNGVVSQDEIDLAVKIALGIAPADLCEDGYDAGNVIAVDDLVRAVKSSLLDCAA